MDIQVARRSFVRRLAQAILKMNDLDNFLNLLTEMVVEVFGVVWSSLSLLDEASGNYIVKACSQKARASGDNLRLSRTDKMISWLKERQRILSQQEIEELGAQANMELRAELQESETSVSVPLSTEKELIAVLNLGPRLNKETFSSEELELLSELTELLSPIIKQAVDYRRLKAQCLHHQNILDNLVSGIIAVDPEGKITVFNRAAERILRFRAEQILGKNVSILQSNLSNLLLDTLRQGKSYRREELSLMPENSLIGVSSSQFYDAKGELLGAGMVFSSLVEIKKKQKLARQQNLDSYWSNIATSL
ncbi:MAG: PAS domain-containing protein, partial [Omnitrophica bacterium]|nr:PAS domain-containing protein [Candidatus Omnitrophota bacterium]